MEPKSNPQAPIPPMDDSDGPSATDYTIPDGMPAVQPPEPEPPPPPPSSPVAAGSSPSASPHAWRPRQAIRVAVEPSPDDRNLLLVRPLAEGETAPEHAHEAMLTAMEAGAHLLSRKR